MSEEEIKGAFDGLPDGPPIDLPPESKEEKAEVREESKDETNKLLAEKDAVARHERERRKEEVKKRKELEAELAQLKEAKIEEEEEKPIPQADVVREVIREENYKQEVVKGIRAVPGITRPMAEELQKLVEQLPKSGDPEADVKGALAYFGAMRNQPVTPSVNVGFGSVVSKASLPESAIKLGMERYNLTPDDFKKHGGEIKL